MATDYERWVHMIINGKPMKTIYPKQPLTVDVDPAVAGVLYTLPAPGTPWPDVEKAKFLSALGAVLDLLYPGSPDQSIATQENQE